MSDLFLVTGANGRHGSTGAHLVHRLLDLGHKTRIFVRRETEVTKEFAARGVEVVVGDLLDQRTIVPALKDVTQAYFVYPVDLSIVAAAANWAQAVRSSGSPVRTVVMSMPPAQPNHGSPFGRASWLAEQTMEWSGIDLQIIRIMAFFHENLDAFHGASIAEKGVMRDAYGWGPISWMSSADSADIILDAMLHPANYEKPLAKVSGTEIFTESEIAQKLTRLLSRPIRYEHITPAEFHDELKANPHPAITPTMLLHGPELTPGTTTVHGDLAQFERLTGQKPRTMDDYLTAFASEIKQLAVH
jgi:uncharacterized protein YbjT (DUF2867 family)